MQIKIQNSITQNFNFVWRSSVVVDDVGQVRDESCCSGYLIFRCIVV